MVKENIFQVTPLLDKAVRFTQTQRDKAIIARFSAEQNRQMGVGETAVKAFREYLTRELQRLDELISELEPDVLTLERQGFIESSTTQLTYDRNVDYVDILNQFGGDESSEEKARVAALLQELKATGITQKRSPEQIEFDKKKGQLTRYQELRAIFVAELKHYEDLYVSPDNLVELGDMTERSDAFLERINVAIANVRQEMTALFEGGITDQRILLDEYSEGSVEAGNQGSQELMAILQKADDELLDAYCKRSGVYPNTAELHEHILADLAMRITQKNSTPSPFSRYERPLRPNFGNWATFRSAIRSYFLGGRML